MAQNGKLMPNLDQNSTKLLNLTVLQRIDPFVEEILITAAHVTLYEFNIDNSQWSRKDVEGSLFVVKRNTQPRFQFIVMNRRNTDNLVENLLEDFEFEIQIPYLLYRNSVQEVNGIWFYNTRECEEVANLFTRILNAYSKVPTKSQVAPAKSDFEELEARPTMAVMDGPLEPSSTAPAADITDDPSFVNFFSTAMAMDNGSNTSINTKPNHPPAVTTIQTPALLSAPIVLMPLLEKPDPKNDTKRLNNLVKPSTFYTPAPPIVSSSSSSPPYMLQPPVSTTTTSLPIAPSPLQSPATGIIQRPYGAPLLQPFPPPTPPPSLTPAASAGAMPNHVMAPVITREKVREALLALAQDNQFIDLVYRAVLNAHPL